MLVFHLDATAGVAPYLQIVQQVKQALRLGLLAPGDQLPTVREVVAQLAVNPNTVLKAYRELEVGGLVGGKPGQGTFVVGQLPRLAPSELASLRRGLVRWLEGARAAGLDDDGVRALVASVLHAAVEEATA